MSNYRTYTCVAIIIGIFIEYSTILSPDCHPDLKNGTLPGSQRRQSPKLLQALQHQIKCNQAQTLQPKILGRGRPQCTPVKTKPPHVPRNTQLLSQCALGRHILEPPDKLLSRLMHKKPHIVPHRAQPARSVPFMRTLGQDGPDHELFFAQSGTGGLGERERARDVRELFAVRHVQGLDHRRRRVARRPGQVPTDERIERLQDRVCRCVGLLSEWKHLGEVLQSDTAVEVTERTV